LPVSGLLWLLQLVAFSFVPPYHFRVFEALDEPFMTTSPPHIKGRGLRSEHHC